MKKIISLLLLCTFALLGCEKNDQNLLVGSWKLVEWRTTDDSSYKQWQTPETTVTFTEDGHFTSKGYFGTGSGTYKTDGKYLNLYNGETFIAQFVIYSLSSNELVAIMESDYYFKFKKY